MSIKMEKIADWLYDSKLSKRPISVSNSTHHFLPLSKKILNIFFGRKKKNLGKWVLHSFLMSIKMDKRRDWLVDSKLSERPLAVSRWIWGGEINDFDIIFPVGLVVF